MLAFWGLHFNHTWDLTAAGTLTLAIATFVSLFFARRSLNQAQNEIALSRREVEESHRPVVVPVADLRKMAVPTLGELQASPQLAGSQWLVVPVENIGAGPAIDLEATVTLYDLNTYGLAEQPPQLQAAMAGLSTDRLTALMIALIGFDPKGEPVSFRLTITYADIAGKEWVTVASWTPTLNRYWKMTIGPLEKDSDAYRVKHDPNIVKRISPRS
jgi:hypothetical protein